MPEKRKRVRKPLGFFDARDRFLHVSNAYRAQAFGGRGLDSVSRRYERELAELDTPEPDEELEDAEITDAARRMAIEKERGRRQGRGGQPG